MKSVNNQVYYAASKLKQFNLKPSRANKNYINHRNGKKKILKTTEYTLEK